VYSKIGDEMARRTQEESGDFVVDRFLTTTRSPFQHAKEGNTVSVVVDPGVAYVDGYRVATNRNSVVDIRKGTDTSTTNNVVVGLDYGNWVYIKEVGGVFQYSTGDQVKLYNTAKGFLSNTTLVDAGTTSPVGTLIGTARIRSMEPEGTGTPGTPNCKYKLYLFDIRMNVGKNFRDVKSVY
jgi:Domain of unknown function (DUF4815)